jgi:hypothetical protein
MNNVQICDIYINITLSQTFLHKQRFITTVLIKQNVLRPVVLLSSCPSVHCQCVHSGVCDVS